MGDVANRRGRPRDENARQAIHLAVRDLLLEHGYGRLTIDGIAKRAGVGRQTVYRWWPTRADVVLEVINAQAELDIPADDVAGFVRATFARAPGYVRVLGGLMAEAQLDPDFAERFRADFLDRRRAALIALVRREMPEVVPELAADLVFGTLWYLVLTRPAALGAEYAEGILATLGVPG